jgi:glycosyltransferase involved in cell wall biosynthesis
MAGLENIALPIRRHTELASQAARLPRVVYALALNPGHKFGSIEEQILTLSARFADGGSLLLPLFICGPQDGKLDFYRARGVPAECLDLRRFRWSSLRALLRLLRTHRIDAMHWNFTSPLGNAYIWWLTLLRPRLRHYFTDHISRFPPVPGPPRGPRRWLKMLLLRRYAKVFCVSQFVLDCLSEQAVWPDRRYMCRYFVNTDRFRPDHAARKRLRCALDAEGRFVVLVVAHLIQAKGIDVLLRAFTALPANAVLWVIGEGASRDELDALTSELGLGTRVRMLGHQFDICPYMQAADCFVCPSLWAEAAGLVNLEAAACGLPVVASRIGGIPEYVADGETGTLFPPGDATALADCLIRLIREPEQRARLGAEGRVMVERCFSPEARVTDVLDLYRN